MCSVAFLSTGEKKQPPSMLVIGKDSVFRPIQYRHF